MSMNELVEKSDLEGHLDELQPGTTLMHGQYTITRFLNNGGFGITYLAKDSLDRDVVIKECFADAFCRRTKTIVSARSRAHQNELKSIIRQFIQEARSLSKLRHPNIVGVHQVFEDNDTAYMAIDFVDGRDLLEIVEDPAAKLVPEQIVDITRKLLSAIGYVHELGLLHRDISPDNILVTRQGEPILIDFGAAREHVGDTGRKHSALRVVKDGYSPQEFYIAGSEQGPWSDLYAMAASLYHAIKGDAPVNGQARLAAIAEQRPDPYEPLAGAVEGYPAGFLEAIDKAMNTKPSMRIQSSAEWLALLDRRSARKGVDGNPEEAISKLLTVTNEPDDNMDAAFAEDAVVVASAAKTGGNAPIVDNEPLPSVATPSKGRGGLMAVSALAVMAVLGVIGYSFSSGDEPASEKAEATQAAAAVETAPGTASALAGDTNVVTAAAVPSPAVTEEVAVASAEPELSVETTSGADSAPDVTAPEPVEVATSSAATETTVVDAVPTDAPAGEIATADTQTAPIVEAAESSGQDYAALSPDSPGDITLPEGVELISPATSNGAEMEPSAANTPSTVGMVATEEAMPEESTVPDVVQPTRPLSTDVAMSLIRETQGLLLPFFHDGHEKTKISTLSNGSEDWMAAGQRIVDVNGTPIRAFEDIPEVLRDRSDVAIAANDSTISAVFGVEAFPGATVIRKTVTIPIVPEITVADSVTVQIVPTKDGVRSIVTGIADGVNTELRLGDNIHLYMGKEAHVEIGGDFREVLLREIALGHRNLNFAVLREGVVWLASLKVDLDS